jgi:hypothetical protein
MMKQKEDDLLVIKILFLFYNFNINNKLGHEALKPSLEQQNVRKKSVFYKVEIKTRSTFVTPFSHIY